MVALASDICFARLLGVLLLSTLKSWLASFMTTGAGRLVEDEGDKILTANIASSNLVNM
jgi:hypothetical protein